LNLLEILATVFLLQKLGKLIATNGIVEKLSETEGPTFDATHRNFFAAMENVRRLKIIF